jgi:hypothetical protein
VPDVWMMRAEGGLSAHFKVPNGPSRPGVHWSIGLKQGEKTYKVLVKALFADDATPETKANQEYQAEVAMQYLNDRLNKGWHPDQELEHTIYISNPPAAAAHAQPAKPWWKLW